MTDLNAILAISFRDLMKLLRDPARIVSTFISPLLLIGILGGTFQANLGKSVGFNYMTFIFTGIFAQTLFQSAAQGVISLIEDRENDFSQEIFVSPISRYSIVFGKILGESLVALPQGAAVVLFGLVIGIKLSPAQVLGLVPVAIVVCILGGTFGLLLLANMSSQRVANQIFPFILLPQLLLAGVFNPIQVLPWYLDLLSRITPMRYAIDLARSVFYLGQPEYSRVVLDGPLANLVIISAMFCLMLVVGTFLFVRGERNR
jgi:ABC-2 type transport system permease protein